MKTICRLAVLLSILLAIESMPAALLTFDDLPAPDPYGKGGSIPTGYGGLNWNNNLGYTGQGAAYYNTNVLRMWGYPTGAASGPQAAYTWGANDIEMSGPLFTFNSAWFSGAVGANQPLTVTAYNGMNLVGRQTIVLSYATPKLFTFNFANVTRLVIDPGPYQAIIDDITINAPRQGPLDSDGDGVPDATDAFPNSRDVGENVTLEGCDTGVPSMLFPDGTTLSDLIYELAAKAKNHGQFVSGVARLKNRLRKEAILTPVQAAAIQECAARSSLP
jgi:hypothetical protein